MSELNRVGGLL